MVAALRGRMPIVSNGAEPGAASDRPDPVTASTAAELVAALNQLRLWAGRPSLRALRDLAGPRQGSGVPPAEALPTSTTHEVLTGRRLPRLPRLDFVEAFVTACLAAARAPAAEVAAEVDRWRAAWRAIATRQPEAPAPVPEVPAEAPQSPPPGPPVPPAPGAPRPELRPRRLVGLLRRRWPVVVAVLVAFAAGGATATVAGTGSGRTACSLPADPAAGSELVFDGGFLETDTLGYRDPMVSVWRREGQLVVKAHGGSRSPAEAILEQRDIPLTAGRLYALSFDISADKPVQIRVATQMQHSPFTEVISHDIAVGRTTTHFHMTAVGGVTTDDGVVTFQLGGHPYGVSFLLDNVSLREYPCP